MKKFSRMLMASIVAGSLIAAPVYVYASDIDAIETQKKEAENAVNSLQKELETALGQISQLETDMVIKADEIAQANVDLEAAQVKEAEQYEAMKYRIRYMYEDGGVAAIRSFTSGSISEMLNQAEYIQKIHSYDRKMLDEYVQTKNNIADLKAQLEQEQKNMQELDEQLTAKSDQLSQTISSKQVEVANLDEQLQAAIIAEEQRKAEEARKAAEEAAKQQQAQGQQNQQPNTPSGGNDTNIDVPSAPSQPETPSQPSAPSQPQTPSVPSEPETDNNSGGNTSVAQTIVNAAYSQLGVPYVWGGTTPGVGLDCSGLTSSCHRVAGISIPRTSSAQLASGRRRVSNPQPGDICWTPGHVAIYIGNGQMIEAPDVGQVVKISRVRASVYVRYW